MLKDAIVAMKYNNLVVWSNQIAHMTLWDEHPYFLEYVLGNHGVQVWVVRG